MAADVCARAGVSVEVLEQRPSAALKFLLAGRGGLNLSHADAVEAPDRFAARYSGSVAEALRTEHLPTFGGADVARWAADLGHPTFTGSSRRVFPTEMKASPLLRSWLRRLEDRGVRVRTGQRFDGFTDGREGAAGGVRPFRVRDVKTGEVRVVGDADALVLAMGGASWPRLGSDAAWVAGLRREGVVVEDFVPANAGVLVDGLSASFLERHAGSPLKHVAVEVVPADGTDRGGGGGGEEDDMASVPWRVEAGELLVTSYGLQGGAVYQLLPRIRRGLAAGKGSVELWIDLKPQIGESELVARLGKGSDRGPSRRLRERAGLQPAAVDLVRDVAGGALPSDLGALAAAVKRCRVRIGGISGLSRSISSAGGVVLPPATGGSLELAPALPGVFVAGEMLDWEGPTGGYLLTASLSLGHAAGVQALARLAKEPRISERFGGASRGAIE